MKQVFTVCVLLALGLIVIGYFRGWYTVEKIEDPDQNKVHINISVDKTKIESDETAVKSKAKETIDGWKAGDPEPAADDPALTPAEKPRSGSKRGYR